ncbi:hypothetical protein LEN26_014870 [Aphanomyces euteiches]|nr:hypothetical protein LEN26_014870 [Aphanomyces euteiches]
MKTELAVLFIRLLTLRRHKARALYAQIMAGHYVAFVHKSPKRTSILTGQMWVDEVLNGNENTVVEMFRMPLETFRYLVRDVVSRGGLKPTRDVSTEEQVAMFLFFAGQNASSRALQCRFQRSGETISRHIRLVLLAMRRMCSTYIKLPSDDAPVHPKIYNNPKFFPFFEDCRMAIDGTHILVTVPADMTSRFQSRKGITMNEGTAGDGKLYEAALNLGLKPEGSLFDILDAGFALTTKALTPYRGTRYHLKEFSRGSRKPQNKEDLFNLRHAKLRNVIERVFGILKKRFLVFPVICYSVAYDYPFQVDLVMVLCMLHNYIRLCGHHDDISNEAIADIRAQNQMPMTLDDRPVFSVEPEINEAKQWRDSIATTMWQQYQTTLSTRRRTTSH